MNPACPESVPTDRYRNKRTGPGRAERRRRSFGNPRKQSELTPIALQQHFPAVPLQIQETNHGVLNDEGSIARGRLPLIRGLDSPDLIRFVFEECQNDQPETRQEGHETPGGMPSLGLGVVEETGEQQNGAPQSDDETEARSRLRTEQEIADDLQQEPRAAEEKAQVVIAT